MNETKTVDSQNYARSDGIASESEPQIIVLTSEQVDEILKSYLATLSQQIDDLTKLMQEMAHTMETY